MTAQCVEPLRRGYACLVSDMGHRGDFADRTFWALGNPGAQIDFGFRATHVAALAGKAIVARFYAHGKKHSYFAGCSTGGYQGMVEGQRFPWDFDGIIAGDPDLSQAGDYMRLIWVTQALLDRAGKPVLDAGALKVLHRAALDACDLDDGLRDGIIGNPFACKVDPTRLACGHGRTRGCLSNAQIAAARRIYEGARTSSGVAIDRGGLLPGSELAWSARPPFPTAGDRNADFLRHGIYGFTAPPDWNSASFNFDHDFQRLGLAAHYQADKVDLRDLRTAGTRLLVYEGGSDTVVSPREILGYYEDVVTLNGGIDRTQELFRLYLIPGMTHCSGGDGADMIDYLTALEHWVERGEPPEVLIGSHVSDSFLADKDFNFLINLSAPLDPDVPVTFTRKQCPWPVMAHYRGHGDPNAAANFDCRRP